MATAQAGGSRGRDSFEAQGSAFLKQNLAEKPEFDYAENRPPRSYDLAGRTLTLVQGEDGARYRHDFREHEVAVEAVTGQEAGRRQVTTYEAFEMAPGILFVTYLASEKDSLAMAMDLNRGAVTAVRGRMEEDGITSRVVQGWVAEIAGEGPVAYHLPFSLGGTRLLNTYAHNVAYEHIYLTGVYETWLGVKGPQAGQADTEEYHAYKVADGVYLLYWNEKILTTQMTFLFNFMSGRCVAELFARVDGEVVHNTIGAYTHLIHTKLPELPNVPRLDIYTGD